MRHEGRQPDQLREVTIQRSFTTAAPGSVLIQGGRTTVLCTASVEDSVPTWLLNTNQGWLTAEYSMLPGSTPSRKARAGRRGQTDGRSVEIGRLIGRALRAACDLTRFPGRTVWIDCDVLQADGGTRTLAVSGAMVALQDALRHMDKRGWLRSWPVRHPVAAVSVGLVDGQMLLDLDYREDSRADVDLNVVMNAAGEFVEVQGAGEATTFRREQLTGMLDLAETGIRRLLDLQEQALAPQS